MRIVQTLFVSGIVIENYNHYSSYLLHKQTAFVTICTPSSTQGKISSYFIRSAWRMATPKKTHRANHPIEPQNLLTFEAGSTANGQTVETVLGPEHASGPSRSLLRSVVVLSLSDLRFFFPAFAVELRGDTLRLNQRASLTG